MLQNASATGVVDYDPDFMDNDTYPSGVTFRFLGGMAASFLALLFMLMTRPAFGSRVSDGLDNVERDH